MVDETTVTKPDPNVGNVEEFERSALDAPEGIYRFRLTGSYGLKETNSGKTYLNVMFTLDQQAEYDQTTGMLTQVVDLPRPHRIFHKFWIESQYGTDQLNSWFREVGHDIKGTFNPATGQYEFLKDEEITKTLDKTAWNRITHKKDENYGWQMDIRKEFSGKPQNRIRVTEGGGAA